MKREKLIKRIVLEAFSHATESEERVVEALKNLTGNEDLEPSSKQVVHGYHGNPIVVFRYEAEGEEAQREAARIFSSLDDFDAAELARSIEARLSRGKMFFRLDKQDAYLGEVRLSEGDDVVRVTVTFYPHIRGREKVLWALKRLGLRNEET